MLARTLERNFRLLNFFFPPTRHRSDQRGLHLRGQELQFPGRVLLRQYVHRFIDRTAEEGEGGRQEPGAHLRLQSRPEHEQPELPERNSARTDRAAAEQSTLRTGEVVRRSVRQSAAEDDREGDQRADQDVFAFQGARLRPIQEAARSAMNRGSVNPLPSPTYHV